METVYKVVRREGKILKSAISRSYATRGAAQLTYKPGKVTIPKFGKVFAFVDLGDASTFAISFIGRHAEIWKSEAPDATPIRRVAPDGGGNLTKRFKLFWIGELIGKRLMPAPKGTVVCSRLTLIEKSNW